jgi:hypothetical protein
MTTLSITQKDILESAGAREDGQVLSFPDHMNLKGGASYKVLNSLVSKGLIEKAEGDDFIITNMGRESIGLSSREECIPDEVPEAANAEESDVKPEPIPSDKTEKTPKGKLGDMLTLLKREEGATVTDLMEATGWQKHSVRGAMSGQLKTKYGLIIQKIATKGEETVYQIAG